MYNDSQTWNTSSNLNVLYASLYMQILLFSHHFRFHFCQISMVCWVYSVPMIQYLHCNYLNISGRRSCSAVFWNFSCTEGTTRSLPLRKLRMLTSQDSLPGTDVRSSRAPSPDQAVICGTCSSIECRVYDRVPQAPLSGHFDAEDIPCPFSEADKRSSISLTFYPQVLDREGLLARAHSFPIPPSTTSPQNYSYLSKLTAIRFL